MTTLTMQFSNEPNGDLFTLGETCCEECPKYAVGLFAPVDDEGLFALCYEHMLTISPLAANVLIGSDAVECGGEFTDLQLMLVDELGTCPGCGGGLDTGAGFGMRDLECGDYCLGPPQPGNAGEGEVAYEGCECGGHDEDAHCGWSGSYPLELYRDKLMPKYLAGQGDEGQQIVAEVVQTVIPAMEPRQ